MHGIGKASVLEGVFWCTHSLLTDVPGVGVVTFMFLVCSGISKVLKYEETCSRGGGVEYESKSVLFTIFDDLFVIMHYYESK